MSMETSEKTSGSLAGMQWRYHANADEAETVADDGVTVTARYIGKNVTAEWVGKTWTWRLVSPAPAPAEVKLGEPKAGRFPPQKGDVWQYGSGTQVEFTGARFRNDWGWETTRATYCRDSAFTDGTLTFVRYATPPTVEAPRPAPERERVNCARCHTTYLVGDRHRCAAASKPILMRCHRCKGQYEHRGAPSSSEHDGCPYAPSPFERGAGIASLSLPPARPVYVPEVTDWDLLPDAETGWRR